MAIRGLNAEACERRNRRLASRGRESAHVALTPWSESLASQSEAELFEGTLPETMADALAIINRRQPAGARRLVANDILLYEGEAANDTLTQDSRFFRLGKTTLINIAKQCARGVSFMNSHRSGDMSAPSELPYGQTIAGKFERSRKNGQLSDRARFTMFMLKGVEPNGAQGPSTDDLAHMIDGGALTDISVGLIRGFARCEVCAQDYNACPHIAGTVIEMTEEEIAAQEKKGIPGGAASYAVEDGTIGEISAVFDGALAGAGFRKALKLSKQGALASEDQSRIEALYGALFRGGNDMAVNLDGIRELIVEGVADGVRAGLSAQPPDDSQPPPDEDQATLEPESPSEEPDESEVDTDETPQAAAAGATAATEDAGASSEAPVMTVGPEARVLTVGPEQVLSFASLSSPPDSVVISSREFAELRETAARAVADNRQLRARRAAEEQVSAGRLLPTHVEPFAKLLVQAQVDDASGAAPSRYSALLEFVGTLSANALTVETVPAGATILPGGRETDPARLHELMNKSPLGRDTLKGGK